MKLRPLQATDALAIAALWLAGATESAGTDKAFLPRVSLQEYAASVAMELKGGTCLGWGLFAEAPERLLAYLTARVTDPSPEFIQARFLYLLDLDVDHEARRQGLGARLVAAAKTYAQTEQLATVEVSWLSADPRASAFWRSQGFSAYLARARYHARSCKD